VSFVVLSKCNSWIMSLGGFNITTSWLRGFRSDFLTHVWASGNQILWLILAIVWCFFLPAAIMIDAFMIPLGIMVAAFVTLALVFAWVAISLAKCLFFSPFILVTCCSDSNIRKECNPFQGPCWRNCAKDGRQVSEDVVHGCVQCNAPFIYLACNDGYNKVEDVRVVQSGEDNASAPSVASMV